jgi:hypothetical protein
VHESGIPQVANKCINVAEVIDKMHCYDKNLINSILLLSSTLFQAPVFIREFLKVRLSPLLIPKSRMRGI